MAFFTDSMSVLEEQLQETEEESVSEEETDSDVSMSQWTVISEPISSPHHSSISMGVCKVYEPMSDSTVANHPLYRFHSVKDPGIMEALLDPEFEVAEHPDSKEMYFKLCSEANTSIVRMFYTNLENSEIDLSYYGVDKKGIRPMAMVLEFNRTVTRLDLTDNCLSDDGCYHLGQMLKVNTTLVELILAGCRIGSSGLLRLGNDLYHNRALVTLDLTRNRLGDDGGIVFANVITTAKVKQVNLSNNMLGRATAMELSERLQFRNPLTHLDLSRNDFNHVPAIVKMINQLADSEILKEINLSYNSLEGERVAAAIYNILNAPQLELLDLSNNLLQGEAINIILPGLIKATKLKTLNLSCNPMSPDEAYRTLQKMLRPRIKIQTLLMEHIYVEKRFLLLLERISKMKFRESFVIKYGDVLQNWTIKGKDPRALLMRRINFLGIRRKRRKMDIPTYFLSLSKEITAPIPTNVLIDRLHYDKVNLNEDIVKELALQFGGASIKRSKTIDLRLVTDYIRRLWPDKKPPETPPPEPEPEPEPEIIEPTHKKKKAVKKKSIKKRK